MQQNPWEADSYPVGLETSYILCNMEVHYYGVRKMSLNPVQSHINSVQTLMHYFFNFITESKFHNLFCLFVCMMSEFYMHLIFEILCIIKGVARAQLFWEVGDRTETVDQIIS
jgi:hypothetical protein